jgi:hypothetical protein
MKLAFWESRFCVQAPQLEQTTGRRAAPARVPSSSLKLGIVLEEADETAFWLDLMQEANVFPEEKLQDIVQEGKELVSIFVASVRTAKGFTSSI